jgi:hypothetical protein
LVLRVLTSSQPSQQGLSLSLPHIIMETLYIVCGLTALVALIALCFSVIDDSPPPQPPYLGVCSPSDSPYVPIPSQQGSYHQPRHPQLPPPRSAIQSLSRYSTLQAPSSSQPSPYQPHRLPSAQYPHQPPPPFYLVMHRCPSSSVTPLRFVLACFICCSLTSSMRSSQVVLLQERRCYL